MRHRTSPVPGGSRAPSRLELGDLRAARAARPPQNATKPAGLSSWKSGKKQHRFDSSRRPCPTGARGPVPAPQPGVLRAPPFLRRPDLRRRRKRVRLGVALVASPATAACDGAAIAAVRPRTPRPDSRQCSHSALSTSRRADGARRKTCFAPLQGVAARACACVGVYASSSAVDGEENLRPRGRSPRPRPSVSSPWRRIARDLPFVLRFFFRHLRDERRLSVSGSGTSSATEPSRARSRARRLSLRSQSFTSRRTVLEPSSMSRRISSMTTTSRVGSSSARSSRSAVNAKPMTARNVWQKENTA